MPSTAFQVLRKSILNPRRAALRPVLMARLARSSVEADRPRLLRAVSWQRPRRVDSGQERGCTGDRVQPEVELSSAVVTMHHTWQPECPSRQSEPLSGATVGARTFGRLEDFALQQPEDAEREAREHRARHEDEVDQWDGKRDRCRDEPRANDAPGPRDTLARRQPRDDHRRLGRGAAESRE